MDILDIIYTTQINNFCIKKYEKTIYAFDESPNTKKEYIFDKNRFLEMVIQRYSYPSFASAMSEINQAETLILQNFAQSIVKRPPRLKSGTRQKRTKSKKTGKKRKRKDNFEMKSSLVSISSTRSKRN